MFLFKKFICLVAVIICLTICTTYITNDSHCDEFERNWDITFLENCDVVYKAIEDQNALGDGYRYHVLKYTQNELAHNNVFKEIENLTDDEKKYIDEIIRTLSVPEEERPCNITYYYSNVRGAGATADKIYILMNPEQKKIYAIESFF